MVLQFYGNLSVRQCEFANWLTGQTICCLFPSDPVCNKCCFPAHVGGLFSHWSIGSVHIPSPVSSADLAAEIAAHRPVEVGYAWFGRGKHLAVVRGWYSLGPGLEFLLVNDPWRGLLWVSYTDLVAAYGYGVWESTWTGIS